MLGIGYYALLTRRSEKILAAFGLAEIVEEKPARQKLMQDTMLVWPFTHEERIDLLTMARAWERHGRP